MKAKSTHALDIIIGAALKKERLRLGLTQTEIARALGVAFQQVQKYENGKNRLSLSALVKIGAFHCIDLEKILIEAMDAYSQQTA